MPVICRIVSALVAALMSTAAVAAEPAACETDARNAVATLIGDWQLHAGRADAKQLTSLYAEDAVLTTTEPVGKFRGRKAISDHLSKLLARHPMGSVAETMTMASCSEAASSGRLLLRVTGERKGTRMLLAGQYAISLISRDGKWQIARHELVLNPRPNRAEGTTTR